MKQTSKYVREGLLLLQEARKTVTAGAAFRPFPGDDWPNAGSCPLLSAHCLLQAAHCLIMNQKQRQSTVCCTWPSRHHVFVLFCACSILTSATCTSTCIPVGFFLICTNAATNAAAVVNHLVSHEGRRAGADSQPYGVGPLETCPPPGSPFADPARPRAFSSEDAVTLPRSPPKQIVRPSACFNFSHYTKMLAAPTSSASCMTLSVCAALRVMIFETCMHHAARP